MGPQTDSPESFGQFLRRERELREIKLEEIAAYTRIKLRALAAIEQDDFASLPPLAFVRAFVRCYADFIGLSIPDVMLRFDGFVQSRYPELTGEVPVIKSSQEPRQHYVIALLLLVVAVLVVLAWWMSRSPIQPPKTDHAPVTGSEPLLGATNGNLPSTDHVLMLPGATVTPGETTTPGATASPGSTTAPIEGETVQPSPDAGATISPGATPVPAADTPEPATEAAPAARVEVTEAAGATAAVAFGPPSSTAGVRPGVNHLTVITAKANCWIGYTIDGVKKGELTLKPGQTVRIEGKEGIRLIIGNPNALSSFSYNGSALDFIPRCSPQHINFPAGPDDKACYPRPAAPAGAAVPPRAPARPAAPAVRPPATPTREPVPARPPAQPRNPG